MSRVNAKQFKEICDRAWSDRLAVLRGSGKLSGEAALMRAVFWRLRKAGINSKACADTNAATPALLAYQSAVLQILKTSSRPAFEAAPILNALIDRYQNEVARQQEAKDHNGPYHEYVLSSTLFR
jgi:hypothetical protein